MLSLPNTRFCFFLETAETGWQKLLEAQVRQTKDFHESAVACFPLTGQREGPEGYCPDGPSHTCLSNVMLRVALLG